MKVLCIGHCAYDIICPVEAFPIENNKYRSTERIDSGGGSASNAAYLLGKWGIETHMAGVVGSDDFGTKIKKELESVQVKTDHIETTYEKPTSVNFVIVNKSNGSRTVLSPVDKSYGQARKYEYAMNPDVILIDGHEFTASREALNRYPNAISIIDADQSTPEILELCKFVKYIVCSKNFAETMAKTKVDYNDPKTLAILFQNLKNRFPNNEIVVTLEEKGALYSINDEIKIMPGLNKQVKDTTGAGDIFHGAFAYGLLNRFPMEKCISYANIAAGLSVDKIGTRMSMPSLSEVISIYNEKNPNVTASSSQAPIQSEPQQPVTPQATPTQSTPQTAAPQAPVAGQVTPQNANSTINTMPQQPVQQPTQNNSATMAIPDELPDIPKN